MLRLLLSVMLLLLRSHCIMVWLLFCLLAPGLCLTWHSLQLDLSLHALLLLLQLSWLLLVSLLTQLLPWQSCGMLGPLLHYIFLLLWPFIVLRQVHIIIHKPFVQFTVLLLLVVVVVMITVPSWLDVQTSSGNRHCFSMV